MRPMRLFATITGLVLGINGFTMAQQAARGPTKAAKPAVKPGARWLGQDGHDVVGPSSALAPSEVQDIHVAIHGLPQGRTIVGGSMQGLGGSQWVINGPYGPWKAQIERKDGATTADLFVEPDRKEEGRPFSLSLVFDDGSKLDLDFQGGKADQNLRMAGKALGASWKGQKAQDHVGDGPNVGPDGYQDVGIRLSHVSESVEVKSIAIDGKGLPGWCFGVNPGLKGNAELIRAPGSPTSADLFFQPKVDLAGKPLTIEVLYANGKTDRATVKSGRNNPKLAMPKASAANIPVLPVKATWLGQEPGPVVGPYDVHVLLENLPRNRPIAAAAMSNSAIGTWSVRLDEKVPFVAESYGYAMALRMRPDGVSADLYFPADRDETGGRMVLRLVFADGGSGIVSFPGGAADVGLRAGQGPSKQAIVARPGDDLNTLAAKYGEITLAKGVHKLTRPLVLNDPITIRGEAGATLQFTQSASDAPWSSAIKIHSGHTTLEDFAIRFAGPVRWSDAVNYGPAVIGTTDNLDEGHNNLKADVNFRRLDIEGPPQGGPANWENAVGLMRLVATTCGTIEKNVLRGGMIELFHGPWKIVGNTHNGTLPNTGSQSVISCHNTNDLLIKDNTTKAVGPSGKTWRFLVMTGMGSNTVVDGNRIADVGPRDTDQLPNANAPETILTENYVVNFEGTLRAISPDRRVIKIPTPQAEPARTGSGLAILTGPNAGQWRRIAQAIDETTYLLDEPLPADVDVISIAPGFVKARFINNRIDARGSTAAVGLVLGGNHFGPRIQGNHFLGAGSAFRLTACPTNRPGIWGWTHTPFVGGVIEGNRLEDSRKGGFLAVEHDDVTKTNIGRVYMSAKVIGNTAIWTPSFLSAHPPQTAEDRAGLVFGDKKAKDPASLILEEQRNSAVGLVDAVIHVEGGRVNGKVLKNLDIPLPTAQSAAQGSAPVER